MMKKENNAVVGASWLLERLDRQDVRVIDASWHMPNADRNAYREYLDSHIPGATFFDIDEIADKEHEMPHMLPGEEVFATVIGEMGIDNDTHVIIYDSYGLFSAARVWWMFRVFGHEKVSILDGGLPAWKAIGGPLEAELPNYPPARFQVDFQPAMVRSVEQVLENLDTGKEVVLDARASARFHGKAPEPRPGVRSGHIPGSKNLPFDTLMEMDSKKVLSVAKLTSILEPFGTQEDSYVCSCGTGVTACVLALGLHLTGHNNVAVYDGSWTEWGTLQHTPVECS